MDTYIYFLRHGETDANKISMVQGHTDIPLNSNGLQQAQLAGTRLQKIHFAAVYSSDLSRAAVTASFAANGKKIIHTAKLREWHLGNWQGKTLNELEKIYPEEFLLYKNNSPLFRPANGESAKEFLERAKKFMQDTAEKHQGQTVLCVSHGGFIRTVLQYVMNIESFIVKPRVDNTAISCFKTSDNGKSWQLILWNDTAHLTDFRESEGV